MKAKFENFITGVIDGRKQGILPGLAKAFFIPASTGYEAGCRFRNMAYDYGWLKTQRVNIPVISVGNIVAGGVGKTPLVLMLGNELLKYGRPGIVLRGYRSEAEKAKTPMLLSNGEGPRHSAFMAGDEAYLLSKNLPQAIVCVGRDKFEGAKIAHENGAEWILLDDGFQHRKLDRDIDIAVVSSYDPFGKGRFLPGGYLRDEIASLKRADLVVVSESGLPLSPINERIIRENTAAPIVHVKQEIAHCFNWEGGAFGHSLKGLRIGVFCGIANPQRFHRSLSYLGAQVVETLYLPDHRSVDERTMKKFAMSSKEKGASFLLCTEKDRVKLNGAFASELPLAWTRSTMAVTSGKEHWDKLISQIAQLIHQH